MSNGARQCLFVDAAKLDDETLTRLIDLSDRVDPPPSRSMAEGRDHSAGDTFIMIGSEDDRREDLYLSRDSGPSRHDHPRPRRRGPQRPPAVDRRDPPPAFPACGSVGARLRMQRFESPIRGRRDSTVRGACVVCGDSTLAR